jgi:hypothetical protein
MRLPPPAPPLNALGSEPRLASETDTLREQIAALGHELDEMSVRDPL